MPSLPALEFQLGLSNVSCSVHRGGTESSLLRGCGPPPPPHPSLTTGEGRGEGEGEEKGKRRREEEGKGRGRREGVRGGRRRRGSGWEGRRERGRRGGVICSVLHFMEYFTCFQHNYCCTFCCFHLLVFKKTHTQTLHSPLHTFLMH